MPRKNKEAATLVGDDTLPKLALGDVVDIDTAATKHRRLTVAGVRQHAGGPYQPMVDMEGIEREEFIFVEMNPVDGAFEIWRGVEVAPGNISVT